MMKINHRLKELRRFMSEEGISASLIVNPDDQFYLSGFKAVTYSRPILLLIGEERTSLIVPGLEEEHARDSEAADEVLVYHEYPEMAERGKRSHLEHLDTLLSAYPTGFRMGVEMDSCPVSLVAHVEDRGFDAVVDIGRQIVKMRYVKDEQELGMMAEAGRLVNLAVQESLAAVRPGTTEIEVDSAGDKALFEQVAHEHPGATLASMVMTPSGAKRTVMPHIFSNTRPLEEGDVIIHSRQVAFNGYRAELERSAILGEPTPQQAEAFEAAREAQRVAMDFIKPGVTAAQVDETARDVLRERGFGQYAVHRVGHGLGIAPHEEPYIRFDNDLVLEEGMVYCVEPGIYVPGLGGFRHSDTVVLTGRGSNPITEYPTDLASLTIG